LPPYGWSLIVNVVAFLSYRIKEDIQVQTILVTGGAGFIGSHLVSKLLGAGFRVRILDSLSPQVHGHVPLNLAWLLQQGVEFQRGSVADREQWLRALDGVDQVVHLAAETGTGQSMYEVARYNDVNSQGTAMLFDVLGGMKHRTVKQVLLASSRSVYGEGAYVVSGSESDRVYPGARSAEQLAAHLWDPLCPRTGKKLSAVPTREDDSVRPASIYAATKFAQEDLVRIGCDALGLRYAIFRLQNVYGEGQSLKNPYTGILSIFSTRVRRGLQLPMFEDGLESRDFVHVDDVAEVFLRAINSPQPINDVINVGSGVATSVIEVATLLSESLGAKPQIVVTGEYRVGDIRHNYADIGKLFASLQYRPKISLQEGMKRFADWVLTQPTPEDQLDRANRELRERKLMG